LLASALLGDKTSIARFAPCLQLLEGAGVLGDSFVALRRAAESRFVAETVRILGCVGFFFFFC
jgi:hypothetical protein